MRIRSDIIVIIMELTPRRNLKAFLTKKTGEKKRDREKWDRSEMEVWTRVFSRARLHNHGFRCFHRLDTLHRQIPRTMTYDTADSTMPVTKLPRNNGAQISPR